uniref:Protein arginine N-methyltransferase 5 n=1 Tax=Denticeps clupeoides TaxID=299321 RepID=A0AAY4B3E4_9TELE
SRGKNLARVPHYRNGETFDFLCMPLFHPRFRREFELDPAKSRPGAQTRSDLLLCGRDWNTLIVGKLSPWIEADSEMTMERRNSEALEVQFIFTGTSRHSEKDFRSYLQYLEYLNQNRPAPNAYELFAKGYEDYLQSPLQPLMDNLESQTYEVFEKDPIKYSQYQQAVYKCLMDRIPEDQKETNVQVLMVLGAGRGPLVNASLRAAKQADRKIRVYAVEKNPNAVVTLENWRFEEWGDQVTVVSCDMREWVAPEKADIIVSELLGSFGDNELSPECLDGAQHFLKDDGVSIPCSYTSFLAPLSSSKLYNEVRGCRERDKDPECQFETPYVVRLHNFHELAEPKPCFTFTHPSTDMNNNRYQCLRFSVGCNSVLHGFAGYFETILYKDVTLSIRPETHSPGMFSWFPILFPLKQPIPLSRDDEVSVRFWRCNNGKKVWYEWAVTEPVCSAIHNTAGRSYTIGL